MIAGLLSCIGSRSALGALAPPPVGPQESEKSGQASSPGAGASGASPSTESILALPPVLFGGTIGYDFRADSAEGRRVVQQGLTTSLNMKTATYIWQPWFATLSGIVGLSLVRNSGDTGVASTEQSSRTYSSKNIASTGNLQLSVLQRTSYPFEFHYLKTDNRVDGTLSAQSDFSSQSFGFSQGYVSQVGNGTLSWDRGQQFSNSGGETRQDSMRLSLSKSLSDTQQLQVDTMFNHNSRPDTGEHARQNTLNVQHNFTPSPEISISTMGNVSQQGYKLVNSSSDSRLMQVSTMAFWRPEEEPLTVTGGVRVLGLANESNNATLGAGNDAQMRAANVHFGLNYEFSQALRAYASGNFGVTGGTGVAASRTASETVGVTYQPEAIEWGNYQYSWSTGAAASHEARSGQQAMADINNDNPLNSKGGGSLSLQLSHGLSRNIPLNNGASLYLAVGQGISNTMRSGGRTVQHLTHSGSVNWNLAMREGTAMMSLSASDSRSLGETNESFQMINFQASSNLPTGRFSSWRGSLTIQAIRQDLPDTPGFDIFTSPFQVKKGFTTTSTGSITYTNQRLFGVRRLRFTSDLRLNSDALLPVLGGPQDMETAAWDNNLDYGIGRSTFRMNTRVAKTSDKMNKSIMFTAQRAWGDF